MKREYNTDQILACMRVLNMNLDRFKKALSLMSGRECTT